MADLKINYPNFAQLSDYSQYNGDDVWKDLSGNIYLMDININIIWNKNTQSWNTKTWTFDSSCPNIAKQGSFIWNDGSTIYLSYYSSSENISIDLYLNGTTWVKFNSGITPTKGFSDLNGNYYCCRNNYLYKWDKPNKKWVQKNNIGTFFSNNLTYIWDDGTNVYYSDGTIQKQFINEQWVDISWNGFNEIKGYNVFKCVVDGNIYYLDGNNKYTYNKNTKTWTTGIPILGIQEFSGNGLSVWDDGINNYFYSRQSFAYKISSKIMSIGDNVVEPPPRVSNVYPFPSLTWQIDSTTGPRYDSSGLKWADRSGNICGCGEYKVSNPEVIPDSGYLYLSDNSERIPYNSNKQIKYAHIDENSLVGALATYYPLWTTGQIENRAVTENKTRYIIFNGNKRYIADSPTATSGTNLTYKSIGYYDGSGGQLNERHWISQSSDPYKPTTYYEIYVMNSTYLSYEYRLSGKSIPNAYNLKSMTFTIPKPSGATSATYTNAKLYDYDVYINGVPGTTEGHAKYKSFSLSSDGTFVINFNSALTYGTWYIKKLVFQVYESTVKNKW